MQVDHKQDEREKLLKLQEYLMEEVLNQLIVNEIYENKKVNITSLELLILSEIYKKELFDEENDINDEYLNKVPKGLYIISVEDLEKNNLLEHYKNLEYKITDKGKEIVEYSISIMEDAKKAVERDSFFGWAYRTLNNKLSG